MNKRLVILRTAVLVFLLGVQTPQFAQDTSTGPTPSDQERLVLQSASLGQLTPPKWSSVLLTVRSHHGRLFWRTSRKNLTSGSQVFTHTTPMFISAPRQKSCPGGICACLCNRMT
jgi:hypothetical protein